MRKFLLYLLLLAVAASAASCRKAVEKAQRNIRFEGIEKIERQGLTGAEIVVRVMNNTGYKLQLETAEIDVYYADGRFELQLVARVVHHPHDDLGTVSPWRSIFSIPSKRMLRCAFSTALRHEAADAATASSNRYNRNFLIALLYISARSRNSGSSPGSSGTRLFHHPQKLRGEGNSPTEAGRYS